MADVTVTIGARDDGSLNAAMQQGKSQTDSLIGRGQQISQALAKGVIPPGGRKLMGAEDLSALEAYEASLKKAAGGAINAAEPVNNVAKAQNKVAGASGRAGSMVERIFERMIIRAGLAIAVF